MITPIALVGAYSYLLLGFWLGAYSWKVYWTSDGFTKIPIVKRFILWPVSTVSGEFMASSDLRSGGDKKECRDHYLFNSSFALLLRVGWNLFSYAAIVFIWIVKHTFFVPFRKINAITEIKTP